jgi:hypothetical protein
LRAQSNQQAIKKSEAPPPVPEDKDINRSFSSETGEALEPKENGDVERIITLKNALDYLGYTFFKNSPNVKHRAAYTSDWEQYDLYTDFGVHRFQRDHNIELTKGADIKTLKAINAAMIRQSILYDKINGKISGLKKEELLFVFQRFMKNVSHEFLDMGEKSHKDNEGLVELGFMPRYADKQAWCAGFADYLRQYVTSELFNIKAKMCKPTQDASDCISVYKHMVNAGQHYHKANSNFRPQIGDLLILKDFTGNGAPVHVTTIVAIEKDRRDDFYICVGGNISITDPLTGDIVENEFHRVNSPRIAGFVDNNSLFIDLFNKHYPGRFEGKARRI